MINSTFCAQAATELEIATIRWLRELVGYTNSAEAPTSATDVGGVSLSGGTAANYTAILLARSRVEPAVMQTGIKSMDAHRIAVPETIEHYTVRAGASWAGLGSDAIDRFPISHYRYDLTLLDKLLASRKAAGDSLSMAVVYAGDSRSMTVDKLQDVAQVFRKYFPDIWMHCDGCHGTSLLFSDTYRSVLEGINEYDSVTLDPHKVLTVPYTNSFLLVRDPRDMETIETSSDLIMRQERSLGRITPVAGSRQFSTLRTWMTLKSMGRKAMGRLIDDRISLANEFAALVDTKPRLRRLNHVNINSVMFVILPNADTDFPSSDESKVREVSMFTRTVYDYLIEMGEVYLHSFVCEDSTKVISRSGDQLNVLRYMGGNPSHTLIDCSFVLDQVIEAATIVERQ
jgi:L-2,4-diaminobutyrate decarboxylase